MSQPVANAVVVDSSIWIEVFTQGALARRAQEAMSKKTKLIVPTVVIFEVYRKLLSLSTEDAALAAVAQMQQQQLQDITAEIALTAVDLGYAHGLPMADSLVLACAQIWRAPLLTLDHDFKGIPDAVVLSP